MTVEPADLPDRRENMPGQSRPETLARLTLYVARATPNSQRAEINLALVMDVLQGQLIVPSLDIVDVFSQPKRALTAGVVVTPTLIGVNAHQRIVLMGDLADHLHLLGVIRDLCLNDASPPG
ncbi:circadian clock KaiB family protein [Lichenihabitans sp. PAMC28606]|uniref:circadian clock KaiB family protein n=1 Tax=Lichenihabitans sp. PAMC28606 TaxID=2880932 RepID=UPI001D0A262A|nr:circadian clock KaiB family protein [Lichenihabitans sp. PAMC28606]UDL94051.1 circadian clock KaiB family protein [Lichenihabitans sp. PAMC28606]